MERVLVHGRSVLVVLVGGAADGSRAPGRFQFNYETIRIIIPASDRRRITGRIPGRISRALEWERSRSDPPDEGVFDEHAGLRSHGRLAGRRIGGRRDGLRDRRTRPRRDDAPDRKEPPLRRLVGDERRRAVDPQQPPHGRRRDQRQLRRRTRVPPGRDRRRRLRGATARLPRPLAEDDRSTSARRRASISSRSRSTRTTTRTHPGAAPVGARSSRRPSTRATSATSS